MRVLTINTYCGSLLIAAQRRGDEIIASLEDAGYGIPLQNENFPRLNTYPTEDSWPNLDLRDVVVIAHPPCAAFSNQNRGRAEFRGAGAPKVKCTERVMEYALSRGTPFLAIESVPGALEGLRSLHDLYARRYGYDVYRFLLNACTFGVPQYRRRFWTLFARKGTGDLVVNVSPRRKTVGEIVKESVGKKLTRIDSMEAQVDRQLEMLSRRLDTKQLIEFLKTGSGSLVDALPKYLGVEGDEATEVRHQYTMGWNYTSHSMIMLQKDWLAPVLIAGSWWWYRTRCLAEEEYKAIMDYPRDYKFPGDYYRKRIREFLSRGVAPSTAELVLRIADENIVSTKPQAGDVAVSLYPGEVTNLKVATGARYGGEHKLSCLAS